MKVYTTNATTLEAQTIEVTVDGNLLLDEAVKVDHKFVVRVTDSPVVDNGTFQSALAWILTGVNNDMTEYAKAMNWIGLSRVMIEQQLELEGLSDDDIADIMEEV